MTGSFDVVGICGSLRRGSFNRMALAAARDAMPPGMVLDVVPIDGLAMYDWDLQQAGFPEPVSRLRDRLAAADAVLFAVPEYNGSMPAVLKNAVDWMSRYRPSPVANKPCAVITASAGLVGGARVQYEFRRTMGFLNALIMLHPEVFITTAQTKFDGAGVLTDAATRDVLGQQMAAFHQWIGQMKRAFGPAGAGP